MEKAFYTEEDVSKFEDYLSGVLSAISGDTEKGRELMLNKYAWPTFNKEKAVV